MLKGIQQQPEIGIRVKILGVRELLGAQYPPGNPQSKHTGKAGTIGRWDHVTENMRSLIIHITGANSENAVAAGIPQRRQSRIRVRRRRGVLWRRRAVCHALRREELNLCFLVWHLPDIFRHHNQRLRSIRCVERALERLRLHAALLAGCFFERRFEHIRLAVQLIRYR